jgi:hypothetical protein
MSHLLLVKQRQNREIESTISPQPQHEIEKVNTNVALLLTLYSPVRK